MLLPTDYVQCCCAQRASTAVLVVNWSLYQHTASEYCRLAASVANITPPCLSDVLCLLAVLPLLLYSAALCHTLAAAGQASVQALSQTNSSNHSGGIKSSAQGQSSSGSDSINSTSKQRQPGIEGLQPGQLQPQADDAMLAYMQRLEEHRKRCELSGRCAAGFEPERLYASCATATSVHWLSCL
jgi:hypothetical protein